MPGTWTRVTIGAKQADVYEPSSRAAHGGVLLFLHGHREETLAGNEPFTAELERRGLAAVCPHGRRSWWLDRICTEFDAELTPLAYLREQIVPYISSQLNVGPPLIAVAGISMGGQGALQLGYRYPREFPIVAAISPAIDFHILYGQGSPLDGLFNNREAARQETATLQLNPLNWPRHQLLVCDPTDADWFEGTDRLAMKLRSLGIPFECDLTTSNRGHSWEYYNAMAPRVMEFLEGRLEQESRRAAT